MKFAPFSLTALSLTFALTAAGVPVSELYMYVVADAGEETTAEPYPAEVVPEPAADDITEGDGDYICYDCRLRFETEAEYVEHVKAEQPDKWEAMKSDHERRSDEYDNTLTVGKGDVNEVNKTVRIILTAGFVGAVGLILFLSIYDNEPEFFPDN